MREIFSYPLKMSPSCYVCTRSPVVLICVIYLVSSIHLVVLYENNLNALCNNLYWLIAKKFGNVEKHLCLNGFVSFEKRL